MADNANSTGNLLRLVDGSADILIGGAAMPASLGTNPGTYGFRLAALSKITETRGDGFAGQIASGGQNYDDATPFKRKVYDNFLGGFGQISDNKVTGGVGIGGDDSKYFYADATTDRQGYLLPGMARNMVYNTYAASVLPVAGDADPNAGDEYEVPRGVVPLNLGSTAYPHNKFTVGGSALNGVTNLRCLVLLTDPTLNATVAIKCAIYNGAALVNTFSLNVNPLSSYLNYNGWGWATLSGTATNFAASTTYDLYFSTGTTNGTYFNIGCYIGHQSNLESYIGLQNMKHCIRPYFQICKPGTATPYKYWSGALRKVHQLLNGSAYVNVAVCTTAWFNPQSTATGGSVANNPEVNFGGSWTGSVVVNNKLYIASSTGITGWSPAVCAANGTAATNLLDAGGAGISSLVAGYGNIYFVTNGGLGISKWNGTFPFAATAVVQPGTIGDPGTAITRIFFYQGNLWAAKPEGLFLLYADPALMGSSVTYTPRITPMGDPFPTPHQSAGAYTVIHQGTVYTNYKDRLYAVTVSATGTQVAIATVPMPWYTLGNYHQIDGIASDGVNLYVSFNNLGVFKYTNQTWHPVTEFYETINTEPTNSGLGWLPNPLSGVDSLYVRDGSSLVQMPMPNANSPYTQQFRRSDQNKCGYLITSATNMEAADIKKWIMSLTLAAQVSGFYFHIRPVTVANTYNASYNFPKMVKDSFGEGLVREQWFQSRANFNSPSPAVTPGLDILVATNRYTDTTNPTAIDWPLIDNSSNAPTSWLPGDVNNIFMNSERQSYPLWFTGGLPDDSEAVSLPGLVQTAFIIYFWNPVPGQATVNREIMYMDSLVVKYQAVQNYLALFKVSLSFDALTQGRTLNLSVNDAETSWAWLRSQFGAHRPVLITLPVRSNGVAPIGSGLNGNYTYFGQYRTFLGFLQNPTWEYSENVVQTDTNQSVPQRVDFQIVGLVGEYRDL